MNNISTNNTTRLSDILKDCKCSLELVSGNPEVEISSIEYNSSRIVHNSLFVAVEGYQSDGHKFIKDAVDRGAGAVVVSKQRLGEFDILKKDGLAVLLAENTRRALSGISAAYFGFPSSKIPVIGITGTNGKTSITYMLESIFKSAGMVPGVIGTVSYRWMGKEIPAPNTTPESKELQKLIHLMVNDGVTCVIMEVSSHALKLNRADDIEFNAGVFTNLTRDHLDFHGTFEDYFDSKQRLFSLLEESGKPNRAGIINIDDSYGKQILDSSGKYSYPLLSYGVENSADYCPEIQSIKNSIDGISYVLENPVKGLHITLSALGRFHVYNSLCAFAVAHRMGVDPEIIRKGLADIHSIPGRFDRIRSNSGFNVIVDYAHTNDALLKLLESARELHPQRLITVFGCGGNRDKSKRPIMGDIAARHSDFVIVTSDNPRNEIPEDIIADIVAGIKGANFEVEADREKAIRRAISFAQAGDLIVIAGKGHEDYQIIGNEKRHFDDHEVARRLINEREKR